MRNRYPGTCSCGIAVITGSGSAVRSGVKWVVKCSGCKTVRARAPKAAKGAPVRSGKPRRASAYAPKRSRRPARVPAEVVELCVPFVCEAVRTDAVVELGGGTVRECSQRYADTVASYRVAVARKKKLEIMRLEADMVDLAVLGHLGPVVEPLALAA